jgi:hypothetical protein
MSDLNTIHSIGVGLAEKVFPRISPRSDRKVIPTRLFKAASFGSSVTLITFGPKASSERPLRRVTDPRAVPVFKR